jgi:branched-subunit amino acid transport protein AzlD
MIQRIQTLWLFIAGIGGLLTYKLPLWTCLLQDSTNKSFYGAESLLLFALIIVTSLLAFFTIFLFKNRSRQKLLCFLGLLLSAGIIGIEYITVESFINNHSLQESSWQIGAILPFLMVILFFLAYLGILKDEKLLRNLDKIR